MTISAAQKQQLLDEIQSSRLLVNEMPATCTIDLLIQFENQLALDEMEACLIDEMALEETHQSLIEFYRTRWERIRRRSFLCYTKNPLNIVNRLCTDWANVLSPLPTEEEIDDLPFGAGPYFILMPTLQAHQDIYLQNIHHLQLNEFMLSDDDELFIPLHACLNNAFVSDNGEIIHVVSKDGQYPKLLPYELVRLASHSDAINKYYEALKLFNDQRLLSKDFGAHLTRLYYALNAGGVHAAGQEYNAGAAANEGIFQFFEYWDTVPPKQKQLLYRRFPILEDSFGRLMRPQDENYRSVRFCVELIAKNIEPIILEYNSAQSRLPQLRQDVIKKQEMFLSAAKNPDYPLLPQADVIIPQIMSQIFSLSAVRRREIFQFEPQKNALFYVLRFYPFALPEFFNLLSNEAKQEAINAKFGPWDSAALIIAAKQGAEEAVNLLLMAKAPVDVCNTKGTTALHVASAGGHKAIVKTLLKYGATIGAVNERGNTALHFAIRYEQKKVATWLLKNGANINFRNNFSNNGLDVALAYNPELVAPVLRKAITLPLQEQKELLLNVDKGSHQSILAFAATKHPYLLIDLLNTLKQERYTRVSQEIINAKNSTGFTVLMATAWTGNVNAMRLLLAIGADIHAYNFKNTHALHLAAYNGHLNAVIVLLDNGACINERGKKGNTSLQHAITSGQSRVVEYLINKDADIQSRSDKGNNALDLAVRHHPELIKPLLLKAMTFSLEEQREFLKNVEGGIYENVLLFAAVEDPGSLPEILNYLNRDHENFVAAQEQLQDFFDFKAFINPLKFKLEDLQKKAINNKEYEEAARTTTTLIKKLNLAKMRYLLNGDNSSDKKEVFISQCKDAIAAARPVLEKPRGFSIKGVALSTSISPHRKNFFSSKTKSAQYLDSFEAEITQLESGPSQKNYSCEHYIVYPTIAP